jgi:putative transcriptional regulator
MTDLRKSIIDARADIEAYLAGNESRVTVQTLRVPDDVDVKAVRENLALSQAQFAKMFGFKLSTLQSWERKNHRRKPTHTARVLLTALQHRPREILEALVEASA